MFADSLEVLDSIRLNFNQGGLFLLNITLAFVMFGVALELKTEKFKKVFTNPKSAINGIGGMVFIAALWGIWHIISGLGIATIMSKKPIKNN